MLILSILGGSNNEKHTICPFYGLKWTSNGRLDVLPRSIIKITNQEFKELLNPSLTIPAGEEHWLSHSILQMDTFQLQLADNPLFAGMNTMPTEQLTLSLTVNSRHSAKTIFEKLTCHPESSIIHEPIENEFATFYAIVKDPFGLVTQITHEKQADPTKKGR